MRPRAFAALFALLTVIAAMTALLAPVVFDRLVIDAEAATAVRAGVAASATLPTLPTSPPLAQICPV